MRIIFHIFMTLLFLAIGCGRRDRIADRLDTIDSLCDTDPQLAVAMLDSTERRSLPEKTDTASTS